MNFPVAFWRARKAFLLEGFLVLNLAALAGDILVAHEVNKFHRREEWIPFYFSVAAALLLAPVFARSWVKRDFKIGRVIVLIVGVTSVLVGLAGVFYHLQSQFLREQTVKHLVYTAPFVAPLAYSGIGTLLIFNRMYAREDGWPYGIAFGALGGYFGNFILTLCDHAQNGFYHPAEWVAVGVSALATGFVTAAILVGAQSKVFLQWLLVVLTIQVAVGIAGFAFHNYANWRGAVESIVERFVHGAPMLAPMLLVNVSVLAGFAWFDWWLAAQSKVRSKLAE